MKHNLKIILIVIYKTYIMVLEFEFHETFKSKWVKLS